MSHSWRRWIFARGTCATGERRSPFYGAGPHPKITPAPSSRRTFARNQKRYCLVGVSPSPPNCRTLPLVILARRAPCRAPPANLVKSSSTETIPMLRMSGSPVLLFGGKRRPSPSPIQSQVPRPVPSPRSLVLSSVPFPVPSLPVRTDWTESVNHFKSMI